MGHRVGVCSHTMAPSVSCFWDGALPLPVPLLRWPLSSVPTGVREAWFGRREMDRRGALSNDLLSAALTPALCLSLVSADWDYSRHGGWAAQPPASA